MGVRKVDLDLFKEKYDEGLARWEMAEFFEVSESTISNARRKLGLPTFPKGTQKLTDAQLADIEAMLDEGMSFSEIHRSGGPSLVTLRRRFPGRGWTAEQRSELIKALHVANKGLRKKHNTTHLGVM